MTVGRAVTAVSAAALLASAQVHPGSADFDALVALRPFRALDGCDRLEMSAGRIGHDPSNLTVSLIQQIDLSSEFFFVDCVTEGLMNTAQAA